MAGKFIQDFNLFPENTKKFIGPHISSQEKILLSIYGPHPKKPSAVLITDYKLIFIGGGEGIEIIVPSTHIDFYSYLLRIINLEEITTSVAVNEMRLLQFIGKQWQSVVATAMDPYRSGMGGYRFIFINEAYSKYFSLTLTKAVTEAKIRLRTPSTISSSTAVIPGIADQLKKLAELRQNNNLSEGEFIAAKKKLLGI